MIHASYLKKYFNSNFFEYNINTFKKVKWVDEKKKLKEKKELEQKSLPSTDYLRNNSRIQTHK